MNELILIVDDNNENLKVLGSALKESGYDIVLAQSAEPVFDILSKTRPKLILLDVMMPEVNGFELCLKLKNDREYKEIPVIFLTAKVDPDDIVKGFQVGGVDYITKPFNTSELKARVRNHLDLKNAKDVIEQQRVELKKLNDTKNKIISLISHDVRSPLASIIMLMQHISDSDFSTNEAFIREALGLIKESAISTKEMLDNILQWAKGQMGGLKPKLVYFDLQEIVSRVLRTYNDQIIKKNITIINRLDKEVLVYADENMINSVVRNFIHNALKFSFKDDKIIIGNLRKNHEIKVYVQDFGTGMDDQTRNILFSNTEIASLAGTAGEKGTGIGMIISKTFVELHGGEIGVESELGEGSKFWFTIPLNREILKNRKIEK